MSKASMVKAGGWFLIAFALAYLGIQLALLMFYNFPPSFNITDSGTFKLMLDGGMPMQILLSIYAFIPLLLFPACLGAYYAFKDINEPVMRLSVIFAVFAAFTLSLALMRWPTFDWAVAKFFSHAESSQQLTANAMFHAFSDYLGTFVGGIFSKVCLSIWFFLVSSVMLKINNLRWTGYLGILAGIYLLFTIIQPFDVLPAEVWRIVSIISFIEFIWLLAFGVCMLYYREVGK